jgi:hypothetical protein
MNKSEKKMKKDVDTAAERCDYARMNRTQTTEGGKMKRYGIWRTERRARMLHCSAGFVVAAGEFSTASDAELFLRSEMGERVGWNYEIRST